MAEEANLRRYNDQVSELPQFFGSSKDTMTATTMVDKVETARAALTWTPEQTFNFFRVALQDNAQDWIKATKLIDPAYTETWVWIKPRFIKAFDTTMDESKVFLICKELAMKDNENPRDFMIRFMKLWTKLVDMIPPGNIDVPADGALRTVDYCTGLYTKGAAHNRDSLQRMFFVGGLPHKLMASVIQKNIPTTFEAYTEAVRIWGLREDPGKKNGNGNGNGVHAVDRDDDLESDENFVNQIRTGGNSNRGNNNSGRGFNNRGRSFSRGRGGQNRGGRGGSSGPSLGQNGNSGSQNQNNSSATNKNNQGYQRPKCFYCKNLGHRQETCYTRINDNKPCTRQDGSTFWPKQQAPINEGGEEEVQGAIGSGPSLFQ
jgi:hypothetical protein